MSNYEDDMDQDAGYQDVYDEMESDYQDEKYAAWMDSRSDDFDEKFAEGECGHENPKCSWVDEEDYDGTVYYWCEEHAEDDSELTQTGTRASAG